MPRETLENETASEISAELKTCTTLIVSIFKQIW